ncbi:phosphoglycerate kinase [bacterium]|nr:phosphoglycerate kinase [bacterium]
MKIYNYHDIAFLSIKNARGLKGARVLLRLDLNVPMKNGRITDTFRIKKALPTIDYLKKKGARIVIVSHLGREGDTLRPVARALGRLTAVRFVPHLLGDKAEEALRELKNGEAAVLENLRSDKREETNDAEFGSALSKYADIYVNEAFSVSHRSHASLVGVPRYIPSYMGLLFLREIEHLSRIFDPPRPFLTVIGGAKFGTKIPLLKHMLGLADTLFVGGALAHEFFLERGFEVGTSLVEKEKIDVNGLMKSPKISLPVDAILQSGGTTRVASVEDIGRKEKIVDVGPRTLALLSELAARHRFILVNGPLGFYEDGYGKGTEAFIKMLARSKAKVILGGGDTVAIIEKLKLEKSFHFVSTGGGAMLDYLVDGELPGIDALLKGRRQ